MPGTYLTPDELKDLTGYKIKSAAQRWLDRNGWPYAEPGVDGWPRVLREYHDARLSGETQRKAKPGARPEWSVPA